MVPFKEVSLLRCFMQMGAAFLLAGLWMAPLALAEDQEEALGDTTEAQVEAPADTSLAEGEAGALADTSVAPGKPLQEKAKTDTAHTSRRDAELEKTLSELKVLLKLTRVQEMYIRSILKESMEKQRALAKKAEGEGGAGRRSRRSAMEAMRKHREETDKRIEAVLSEEQVKLYRAFQEEQREKMRGARRQRRGRR